MPSYRYTRDIKPEDTQTPPPPEYTKKEKRANWWHYHWKWLLVGAAALGLVVFFIVDVVTKEDPDVTVGLLTPVGLPQQTTDELADFLAAAWETDGARPDVMVEVYTIDASEAGEDLDAVTDDSAAADAGAMDMSGAMDAAQMNDPYAQIAGVVKLSAVYQTGDVLLFLAAPEQAEAYQKGYLIFGQDGAVAPEDVALEEVAVRFSDLPGYADLPDTGPTGAKALLADYWVGIRPLKGTGLESEEDGAERWQAASLLLERLGA